MTDLAKLVVKLEAQTSQYVAQLDSANKKLDKFTKKQETSLAGVGKVFAAMGTAAATALLLIVKNSIDSADHLNDLSKQTGVSTEALSRLEFAAKQSGGTLDDVSVGLKKLGLAMSKAGGDATSDAATAFKLLGISVKDASGNMKDTETVFKEIADKFSGFQDGANKNALAMVFFSKSFQALIPLLNEGRSGIDAMEAQSDKLGFTVSGSLAKAADDFNDQLGVMKAQLVDGLANQIAADVLPAFTGLAKAWQEDEGRAQAMSDIAGVLAGTLKGLVTGGIIVTSIFQQLGQAIYSTGAAMYALSQGDYKQAWAEMTSGYDKMVDNVSHDIEKINALWDSSALSTKNIEKSAAAASKLKTPDAPNITGVLEAQKKAEEAAKKIAEAAKAAKEKLSDMNVALKEQVDTFGMSEAAATAYKLTLGTLADDVKKAGSAGEELRKQIIAQADALEKLNTQKDVMGLDQQIQELLGHTTEAAVAAFDLSNEMLKASLVRTNNEDGLARLETLRKLTIAQASYNEVEQQRQDILDDLQRTEDRIQHSQEVGAVNELEALSQLDDARTQAVAKLQTIAEKQDAIAKSSGNPALVRNAAAAADAVSKLRDQTDLLAQKMKSAFEDIGSDALASFLDGTKSASDAVKSFIGDLEKSIADFVAKDLMRRLVESAMGSGGGGTGGSGTGFLATAASFIGGIFGGSRDSGGMGQPGKAYAIGTGAQPEIFVPRSHGQFIPAGAGGGGMMKVDQHFHFASPTDRHTQTQIGARAAGGVASAQRRNG